MCTFCGMSCVISVTQPPLTALGESQYVVAYLSYHYNTIQQVVLQYSTEICAGSWHMPVFPCRR